MQGYAGALKTEVESPGFLTHIHSADLGTHREVNPVRTLWATCTSARTMSMVLSRLTVHIRRGP